MISIIGMPLYYGCDIKGTELVYDFIKSKSSNFNFNKNIIIDNGKIFVNKRAPKYLNDKKLKYVESIIESNQKLYNVVYKVLEKQQIPVVIGGDHSCVIGNIMAVNDYYNGDVTVIWIDSHMDSHTEKTSPSGNVHGLPVSICMKENSERFNLGKRALDKENFIYFGISNFEKEEEEFADKYNIKKYMYTDIVKEGINKILEEIITNIKTKHVHISFDFDSLNPEYFSAVNVAKEKTYLTDKGFNLEEGLIIIKKLISGLNVSSIDLVEYNPLLDTNNDIDYVLKILKEIDENIK